uniref:Histone domain-containing protein n=1 Tax=Steinernema glaseri TaxID=37863 RepID=A0A1I7Y3G4_9BILA
MVRQKVRLSDAVKRTGLSIEKKAKELMKNKRKSRAPSRSISSSTTPPPSTTQKKRAKPGVRALQEIRKLQKTTQTLIPRAAFSRLVREIVEQIFGTREYRIRLEALLALQESAEAYLTCLFEDMQFVALHAKRITIMPRDLHCVQRIRKPFEHV